MVAIAALAAANVPRHTPNMFVWMAIMLGACGAAGGVLFDKNLWRGLVVGGGLGVSPIAVFFVR